MPHYILRATAVILFLGGSLTGCNTVEGAGKDVKAAGEKLDNSAARNNTYTPAPNHPKASPTY